MGIEQSSQWYDQMFRGSAEYHKPPADSVYVPLWNRMLDCVLPGERVADFGCGPGQLAWLAFARGVGYAFGVDFSPEAIDMARRNNPAHADQFHLGDLGDPAVFALADYDVAMFSEVLEHVADDLDVVASVPHGRKVILSVPTSDSASHVRFFTSIEQVIDRYSQVLVIEPIDLGRGGGAVAARPVELVRTTNGALLITVVGTRR